MKFGDCQLKFDKIKGFDKAVAYLLALPKPTKGYRSSYADEAPSYIQLNDHLLYSQFPIKRERWVKLTQAALDHAGLKYTHETLRDGKYTNDTFIFGKHAIYIASLKRGGLGILACDIDHVNYMRENDKATRSKAFLRKAALESLTPAQRKALGL